MDEHGMHDMTPEDKDIIEELKGQVASLQVKVDVLSAKVNALTATSADTVSAQPTVPLTQPVDQSIQPGYTQSAFGVSAGTQPPAPQSPYVASAPTVAPAPASAPAPAPAPVTPPSTDASNQQYYQQGYSQPAYTAPTQWPNATGVCHKDHVAAALLAIFLGSFGVHKFYLGYNTAGFIMLAVSLLGVVLFFVPSVVVWLIGVIEGIVYLMKSQEEFDYLYVRNKRLWF